MKLVIVSKANANNLITFIAHFIIVPYGLFKKTRGYFICSTGKCGCFNFFSCIICEQHLLGTSLRIYIL